MPMKDPDWLAWARELQAIAQIGLAFCRADERFFRDIYNTRLRDGVEMLENFLGLWSPAVV